MKIILFGNTDWYLYNFRISLAIAIRDQGHEVILASPSGPYAERLQALNFRWIPVPMDRRSLNPFRELAVLGWLWRLMRREQPDVMHTFTIKSVVYGGLVARLMGIKRVNAIDGMGYVFTNNTLKARLLQSTLIGLMRAALGGEGARLILQNPDDVQFIEGRGIVSCDLIRLIPGVGVDCFRFKPPMAKGISTKNPLKVVLAARLLWSKGLAEFVEAARILKSGNRQVQFLLAGVPDFGNPAAAPEETILQWQSEGLVQWLGHVTDMPNLLASADVVVLPTSYREGLPTSLIEAAACARPLITTDVPGCREVVTHEVDGLLVPVGNAQALAQAIARLQDDPELAGRLGLAAQKKVLDNFEESIIIRKTLAVYDEFSSKLCPIQPVQHVA